MTKIAVSSSGNDLDSPVDPRFGRAARFLIVDEENLDFSALDNSASGGMAHGAGIQAAENVARSGATVVLSGFVGPKAYNALSAAGVRIGQGVEGMTVREAVQKFKDGGVKLDESPKGGGW